MRCLVESANELPTGAALKSKLLWLILGGLGVLFILSSLIITGVEYQRYKGLPLQFPQGSMIAGVPVGSLDRSGALARLTDFYNVPLQLEIEDAVIHANPAELGLQVDLNSLVDQAVGEIINISFWDYLWGNHTPQTVIIPLEADVDEDQLLTYLSREIVPRYTQPGSPITPIPGTTNFQTQETGLQLDVESAVNDVRAALLSPTSSQVTLKLIQSSDSDVEIEILESFLMYIIQEAGFDELVEIFVEAMGTGQKMHFAVNNNELIPPDIAFTAASTIKIPIMISVLRRTSEPTPDAVAALLEDMIILSQNPPADTLMSSYIDPVRGPLMVSEDLAALGLDNTFLAGFFAPGSPVLQIFETPANTRQDIFLDPDIYNQTVPAETGQLLSAIYTCARDGSGLLTDTFPGEITQSECQLMVDKLSANRIGLLIEASLPPGATVAHKHGWVVELDGLIHAMSDSGVVFTPEQDYVMTVFLYDPDRLDFDEGNRLVARLSQTVYNFFNLENQAYWWFD